jgi:hypothetical protein
MPLPKPPAGPKKTVKVTTIPPSRKRRKNFFEEYYYGILAVEFLCVTLLFAAGGLGFYQGILVGLVVTTATAVVWQLRQLKQFKSEPAPLPPAYPADFKPIRPAKRPPVPVGPDGKKVFPPSYFPPLRDRKPPQ